MKSIWNISIMIFQEGEEYFVKSFKSESYRSAYKWLKERGCEMPLFQQFKTFLSEREQMLECGKGFAVERRKTCND